MLVIFPHADGSHVGSVFSSVYVFCLVFPHDISTTDAARITKLDTEMFYRESWKPVYFGFKRSRSLGTKTLPAWVIALL